MVTKAPKKKTARTKKAKAAAAASPLSQTVKDSAQQLLSAGREALGKAQKLQKKAQSAASEQWDRLEALFEERVASALQRLGVPSRAEFDALNRRIDALAAATKPAPARKPAAKAKPIAAKKAAAPAKKAAPRKPPAA